jgi:hypothetical protein
LAVGVVVDVTPVVVVSSTAVVVVSAGAVDGVEPGGTVEVGAVCGEQAQSRATAKSGANIPIRRRLFSGLRESAVHSLCTVIT